MSENPQQLPALSGLVLNMVCSVILHDPGCKLGRKDRRWVHGVGQCFQSMDPDHQHQHH